MALGKRSVCFCTMNGEKEAIKWWGELMVHRGSFWRTLFKVHHDNVEGNYVTKQSYGQYGIYAHTLPISSSPFVNSCHFVGF